MGQGDGLDQGPPEEDDENFSARSAKAVPATVRMFSGCKDAQTSADVYDVSSFGLPEDVGPGGAGGACTNALMSVVTEGGECTWVSMLKQMRDVLQEKGFEQIPQLSSSRQTDLNSPFSVQHPDSNGNFRALLVGINYVGQQGELRGCHNDVESMKGYLLGQGYSEENMRVVCDDSSSEVEPTYDGIVESFRWLTSGAQAGDSLFFHYSGHGGSMRDETETRPTIWTKPSCQ